MDSSKYPGSTEGKETKITIAFGKVGRVAEQLRLCQDKATSIKVKLFGVSPDDQAKAEELPVNPIFFDRLFDELHNLNNLATGLKVKLDEINDNL